MHSWDWSGWHVIIPALNSFLLALAFFVLSYMKDRLEELQKRIENKPEGTAVDPVHVEVTHSDK